MRIRWVKVWIDAMATLTERFRDEEGRIDFEALGREEYEFRHALVTGDYSRSSRARDFADAAAKDYKVHSENGKKGGRPAKKLSADGDTREGSLNVPDGRDAAKMESSTSADTKPAEPAKNTYGEFGNVKMTTAEFEKFVQAVGAERANALIEELSSYLASSGKRYKSHYATLLNWGRRKATESRPQSHGFKTAADRDREEIKKIADYYAKRREDNGKEAV